MIRPLTCLMLLLACASGLYVYQAKHRVHLLDQQIEQTVKATEALREQTRMLGAEWTLLSDPERLRQLADQFLPGLKTVAPGQFTSLAELDSRLPAPLPTPPATPPAPVVQPDTVPVAANDSGAAATTGTAAATTTQTALATPLRDAATHEGARDTAHDPAKDVVKDTARDIATRDAAKDPGRDTAHDAPSLTPVPVHVAALPAPVIHPVDHHAAPPHPVPVQPATQTVAEPHLNEPRPFVPASATRPYTQPATSRLAADRAPQPDFSGSLLGMAHSTAAPPAPMPLPRPMPVSTPQWNYTNGG
jgi:hypothetical protein